MMIPWKKISDFTFVAEKCQDADTLAKYVFDHLNQLIQFDGAVLLILDSDGACQHFYQTGRHHRMETTKNCFQKNLVQEISREYRHHYPSLAECVLDSRRVVDPSLKKYMERLGVREVFGLGLWDGDGRLRCIFSLERQSKLAFSHEDKQVVDIIFHHLNNLYQNLAKEDSQENLKQLPLTKREREIGRLLMRGMNNDQVADQLGISPATVAKHIANMHHKLGVQTQQELLVKLFNSNGNV